MKINITKLPIGWKDVKLEEVCDILDNLRKPISKINRVTGVYPYYGATGIVDYVNNYIFNEKLILLGEDGAKWESGENSSFIVYGKYWVNNHAHVLRPNRKICLDEWLVYFLNNSNLLKFITGLTVPKLNQKNMRAIPLPLPPLPEQKRIVSILDNAFDNIKKAKANYEKNLNNAKELFENFLESMFTKKNIGWKDLKILELCDGKENIVGGPFGSNLKVEHYKNNGIPILRLQNIGKGYFIDKDIKYISNEKANELKYHSFQSGDLALAKLGIPIGKTCIIPENFEYGIVVADVVRIRPNRRKVEYNFLNYFLNSNVSVSQLTKNISGSTRPRVNLDEVRNIIISIPSLNEQQEIVEKLDKLKTETQKLETTYIKQLENLEELKKSLLEKAFKGEL